MTSIQEFIDKKELPAFLKKGLNQFSKVGKVYPKIGLPNCSEDIVLDNDNFVMESAKILIQAFSYIFDDPAIRLYSYKTYYSTKKVTEKKLKAIYNLGEVLGKLIRSLSPANLSIHSSNGKISLKLCTDICDKDGSVVYKKGESLFKVYNKIYQALTELKCGIRIERLDSMPEFKRFSSDNLPHDRFQVVFSSDGIDGLWDIATMSMRGITSCQSWDGQYKKALIGSIVDPFVGLIYITSGTNMNKLGSKMIKRSLVRLVIDSKTKKPFIIVDRMYPECDNAIKDKFIAFIKTRVGDKFDVVYGPSLNYTNVNSSYIPKSDVHNKLEKTTLSYRDTKVPFKIEMAVETTKFRKNVQTKQAKFRNLFRNTAFSKVSLCDGSLRKFKPGLIKDSVKIMLNSPDFKFLVRTYYCDVAEKTIHSLGECDDVFTSAEYMRRLCFYYLNNKDKLVRGINSSFVKTINMYFNKKNDFKVNYSVISKVLETVQENIDKNIKTEIKQLLEKKTAAIKLPD